jgi:hypothetical protein
MRKNLVEFKRYEVLGFLNKGIAAVKKMNGSTNWKYAIFRNAKVCEMEVEGYPNEIISVLETRRSELCEKLSEKDENGKSIIENNQYRILNISEFNSEYAKIHDELKPRIDEYNKFLGDSVRLDLYVVGVDDLPPEITPEQMEGIQWMID